MVAAATFDDLVGNTAPTVALIDAADGTESDTQSAIEDLVRHGIDSLTVPLAEPDALAAAIESLLVDEGLRKRLGEAGRQRARTGGAAPLMWQRISAICHRAAGP